MKKKILIVLFVLIAAAPAFSRDFIIEFVAENYKEIQASFSYKPLIYHSIQVNSSAGPKVLVLKGENDTYRKWLRHYIADNRQFIIEVADSRVDEFISTKAFEIDVASVHPFSMEKWGRHPDGGDENGAIEGMRNILVVDENAQRAALIRNVLQQIEFNAVVFSSKVQALKVFRLQPEKFQMVMIRHGADFPGTQSFVSDILRVNYHMPVIIDVGYQRDAAKNQLVSEFSKAESVKVKSLVLQELPKTVAKLIYARG